MAFLADIREVPARRRLILSRIDKRDLGRIMGELTEVILSRRPDADLRTSATRTGDDSHIYDLSFEIEATEENLVCTVLSNLGIRLP